MSEPKLLGCPFCGVSLVANSNPLDFFVARYGTHYSHPTGNCFLEDTEVSPSEVADWNTRAKPEHGEG